VLYVRHGTLRILGLADKTLIVDEVHACDEYQRAVLKILIEFQARVGATVILLSATLPQLHRQDYATAWARGRDVTAPVLKATTYPLITQVRDAVQTEQAVSAGHSRHVEVVDESDFGAIVQRITAAAQSGQCVCWIRNTVKDAIEAYDMIEAQGVATDLFHARFTNGDRADIEKRVLARFGKDSKPTERHGQVLVATQVVEQSLDLDFDLMVTDLAPIDLLIQRAGRLHRHDRGDRGIPTMVLHAPRWVDSPSLNWVDDWNRGTAIVYPDHGRLWLTMKIIRERNGIHVPEDARLLIEAVYGAGIEENIPEPLAAITIKQMGEGLACAAMSGYHAISPNGAYESDGTIRWQEERAPTRLGDPTVEWVLTSDAEPLNGSVPESTVRLRLAALVNADSDSSIKVHPWQRVMSLCANGARWSASGDRGKGRSVNIQYDRLRGLVVT
jgi:CRISPR-associated endonuclease/helicase Cas3